MNKKERAKERILDTAKELFGTKGFDNVSVREIAQKAECSHTTIYFYFKDKIGVLEEIAKVPLEQLYDNLYAVHEEDIAPIDKVKNMAYIYVEFGLRHNDLYELFMTYKGIRVDSKKADWPINALRLKTFDLFYDSMKQVLERYDGKYNELDLTRGVFFTLHGIVMTYADSDEEHVIERVFDILNNYFAFIFKENMNESKNN